MAATMDRSVTLTLARSLTGIDELDIERRLQRRLCRRTLLTRTGPDEEPMPADVDELALAVLDELHDADVLLVHRPDPEPAGTLTVEPITLAQGLVVVWPWRAAVDELRSRCDRCGPRPCSRHGHLRIRLAAGCLRVPDPWTCLRCGGPARYAESTPTQVAAAVCTDCLMSEADDEDLTARWSFQPAVTLPPERLADVLDVMAELATSVDLADWRPPAKALAPLVLAQVADLVDVPPPEDIPWRLVLAGRVIAALAVRLSSERADRS
jgi:hypothetical protein